MIEKINILITDDSYLSRELTMRLVSSFGLQVKSVENGESALKILQQEQFHLILMDCQMPVLDGYQTTIKIRQADDLKCQSTIPIIAITAVECVDEVKKKCLEAGMNDVITKGELHKKLKQTLEKWLKIILKPEPSTSAQPLEHDSEKETGERVPVHLNVPELMKRVQQNSGLARILLEAFIEKIPEIIERFPGLSDREDFTTLRREAHSVKGGALTIGAAAFAEKAREVEQAAKLGDKKETREKIKYLLNEFIQLKVSMLEYLETLT